MSSRRNKRRRSQKEWKDTHEAPPPTLRLVEPVETNVVPIENSPGRDIPTGVELSEPERPVGDGGEEESQSVLVAAPDTGPTDRIAQINPVPIELGYYLVENLDSDIQANKNAYREMFLKTDCLGLLLKSNYAFGPWVLQFNSHGVDHWELSYNDWIRNTDLTAYGKLFWYGLADRIGVTLPLPEVCHLVRLGALSEMLYAGQLDKAVALYNGWARFAGYGEIALKSHNPPIVDIGNALLQITDRDFKVILVR